MIEKQRAAPAYIQIERVFHEPTPPMLLHGKNIEYPAPGQSIHRRSVEIVGWCLGQQQQVIAVEVVHNEHVIQRVPIAVERPDIAEGFPTVFGAVRSGFCTRNGRGG